jgi:hypothetical protein
MPADYTALKSAWNATGVPSGVTGTPLASGMTAAEKLAAIQGWTVAGPSVDVPVSEVVAYLAIQGKLTALKAYAATASPTAGTNQAGVTAAADLLIVLGTAAITTMRMSDPAIAAGIEALLSALVADSANSGITTADQTALLALAATTMPWWQTAGLKSAPNLNDLAAAGLS